MYRWRDRENHCCRERTTAHHHGDQRDVFLDIAEESDLGGHSAGRHDQMAESGTTSIIITLEDRRWQEGNAGKGSKPAALQST